MRQLLSSIARIIKRRPILGQSSAQAQEQAANIQAQPHPKEYSWWSGVSWKTDGNEEFTKWWNHWMSRIPHGRPVITTSRYGKKDV